MENEFFIGQRVVHSREGLSTIDSEVVIAGSEYFVVHSENDKTVNIYVSKKKTEGIIRPVMNKEEADKLIQYIKNVEAEFTTNTKQRRDLYKKKLASGNAYDLAFLSTQLYLFNFLNHHGTIVKLGPTDIEMLKSAEKMLLDEMAITYNIPRNQIESFFIEQIKNKF